MTNPTYKKGVGQLTTTRYDFQDHVDGYSFKHKAAGLVLFPSVDINGNPYSNVQEAIDALAQFVSPPTIIVNDATPFVKGIVQLTNDFGGTATAPKVTGIQDRPVNPILPTTGQVLQWTGSEWKPETPVATFTAAGDLFGTNVSQTVIRIQGRSVQNVSPSDLQVLTWNNSQNRWEPRQIHPTGTSGFVTVTSSVIDAAATANIRYTGGKFQTSANIQYLNGGVTGDLVWAPTSINKTLTLPNATDTLVALATTDTLLNKTLNATNNTITDTSATLGDILAVISGTKFTRLAKGANGTFLGVSGGVLGYYAPAGLSAPTGTGFAHVTSGSFDAAATANIRYTGGKFQTDLSIQFKSGSFTGDLAWGVSGSNKTMTIPDITDTLVTKTSTDTLTNKTYDVVGTGNNLTSTGQVIGDLLKNDGTKFVRFGRGAALQFLRTNSAGTDLEWATVDVSTPVIREQAGAGQLLDIVTTAAGGQTVVAIRFTGDGSNTDITLAGLVAPNPSSPQRITLIPTGTNNKLIISHQDASESTLARRIICPGSANFVVGKGSDGYAADIIYDTFASRWRVIASLADLSPSNV